MLASTSNLIKRYREASLQMDNTSDPQKANKWHDEWHAYYKILRATNEGREAIIALMQDEEPAVRCGAASHSLQWAPEIAREVLEALRDSPGSCKFEAQMILTEYDKGRLTFDY